MEKDKVKDLVCGMMIDPQTAAATSEYNGEIYHFCARGCKVDFDKDPEKYLKAEDSGSCAGCQACRGH